MKRVATIILNRNLPDVTDRLCAHLQQYDGAATDLYVVEAGSDDDRLSRHVSWHANWPEARSHKSPAPQAGAAKKAPAKKAPVKKAAAKSAAKKTSTKA